MSKTPNILSGEGLSKSFGPGAQVLDGLNISVPAGELTLIKGPSGCGKSTLLAILAGLTAPDRGRVRALQTDLWSLSPAQRDAFRLAEMGFIFQGSILFPALTAREQIEFVLGQMGLDAARARARASAALRDIGLEPRAHLRPDALSGGEKQRVSIACALAKQPKLIFADEPTSALDSENAALVGAQLRRLSAERGATVLCVTHDDRLSDWADRILHMRGGRMIEPMTGAAA